MKAVKSVVKLGWAPIKFFYDPVGAFHEVMSGVKGIFSGLTPKLGSNEPSAQTVRSSKAPARYLLGRVNTGGVLAWVHEQAGSE